MPEVTAAVQQAIRQAEESEKRGRKWCVLGGYAY
jgi:hypothetical protein